MKIFTILVNLFTNSYFLGYNKLFLNIFLLITCLTFTIQSYAITENEYIKINKLIEIDNIDKAFDELKFIQSKHGKNIIFTIRPTIRPIADIIPNSDNPI